MTKICSICDKPVDVRRITTTVAGSKPVDMWICKRCDVVKR